MINENDVNNPKNIDGMISVLNIDNELGDINIDSIEKMLKDEDDEYTELIVKSQADSFQEELENSFNKFNHREEFDRNNLNIESDNEESSYPSQSPSYPSQSSSYPSQSSSYPSQSSSYPSQSPPYPSQSSSITYHKTADYANMYTEEQRKQKIINKVIGTTHDSKFSIEKEKEEDDKAILLEQIDMLITNLKDEGINIDRIPEVDHNSSLEDIENVHKILRLKNDRNRYCTLAEECILAGSHTLEWMFDGEKKYFGKQPDLRGWSATVNIKLRRMRYDTSTFVSEVMQEYNLSHGTRIMFELIPSLFLYSKMKKSQYADNLITSDQMNEAIDRIRDIEES